MFLMERKEVENEITKINTFLQACLWMDFEFTMLNAGKIVLSGTIDPSYSEYVVDIEFDQPHSLSTLFFWHTNTSLPFIELANEMEEIEYINKYHVELGNFVFNINAEDFEKTPIYIAAKQISCKILNDNPFS